jgi:hypothetical protein
MIKKKDLYEDLRKRGWTYQKIAKKFLVSPQAVWNAVNYKPAKTWRK